MDQKHLAVKEIEIMQPDRRHYDERIVQLHNEVVEIRVQMARIVAHLESEREDRHRLNVVLEGDSACDGIKTRIDRIEQIEQGRKWHFRNLWAAIILTFVAWMAMIIQELFTKK